MKKGKPARNSNTRNVITTGKIFVNATFNNTIVTVTDEKGNTLAWSSAGKAGFKGTRKSTPFAATSAADSAIRKVRDEHGLKSVAVFIKGPGPGRDAALRAIKSAGIQMTEIADVTPIPYNGPRARKKRRV